MKVVPAGTDAANIGMTPGRVFGAYLQEARSECLRYLRSPEFILPMLLFSTIFYLMFGVFLNHGDAAAARYLLASYSAFGIIGPGLFGFGASLAVERDGGLLTLKRALPMPPAAYLLGKMIMAMMVASVVVVLLMIIGIWLARVHLSPLQMLALLASGTFGVVPFCALGMFVGTLIKGQGAPGLLNLIYLPMAFLSGLWLPLSMLPLVVQRVAPIWPAYHLNQLTQSTVGNSQQSVLGHVLMLMAVAVVFLLLAARRLRRFG